MNLFDTVTKARSNLVKDLGGRLSLADRKSIWLAMANSVDNQTAYERRIKLESKCVRHVIKIWYETFPQDFGPELMLSLAEKFVNGEIDEKLAQRERDKFYVDVVEDRTYLKGFSAMFVGHAAANTVISAIIKNNNNAIPSVDDDDDLDPESFEPSYLCAAAAAGGLNYHKSSNPDRRREFWEWYINKAIPSVGWQFL